MPFQSIPVADLNFAVQGGSYAPRAELLDPTQDPCLRLQTKGPQGDSHTNCLEEVPSIEAIEDALNTHVREGTSPFSLIEALLHPFGEIAHIDLRPGNGKLRPSYALTISPFGLSFGRGSTRSVAEGLHDLACEIARHPIGRRAPKDAPDLFIEFPGYGNYPAGAAIKAMDHEVAVKAYLRIFGRRPASVHVPIPMSAEALLEHALCAREIITQETMGTPVHRQQALDIITASQDLRTIATVILRRNPDIPRYANFWINISLGGAPTIEVSDNRTEINNSHEKLVHEGLHHDLKSALKDALRTHPILDIFPEGHEIRLCGETLYLSLDIVDTTKASGAPGDRISSSMLEYSKVEELSKHLEGLHSAPLYPEESWKLTLNGTRRTRGEWTMQGQTFAHAIARTMRAKDGQSAMALFDLIIDLLSGDDGAAAPISLHRVIAAT